MSDYPGWICESCGNAYGRRWYDLSTWHTGDPCGWCGKDDAPVTEPRDFGYPPVPAGKPQEKRFKAMNKVAK